MEFGEGEGRGLKSKIWREAWRFGKGKVDLCIRNVCAQHNDLAPWKD